jgi:flagellar basal body-associated protein FliL
MEMESALIAITIVALIFAVAMAALAWRVAREERRRGAARVAALANAASADDGTDRASAFTESATAPMIARFENEGASLRSDATMPLSTGFLGAERPEPAGHGHQRTLAIAAVAVLLLIAAGLLMRMGGAQATRTQTLAAQTAPLELVSLNHQREGARLSVSGLVRNPPSGAGVERLSAVVFLFDQQGTFVTSARAPVDFTKLSAGDESPFVVSLDAPATVARYRVSFRTDAGIVPHVDRRGAPPMADGSTAPAVGVK